MEIDANNMLPDVRVKLKPLTDGNWAKIRRLAAQSVIQRDCVRFRLSLQMPAPIQYREIPTSMIVDCRDLKSMRRALSKLRSAVASLDGVRVQY